MLYDTIELRKPYKNINEVLFYIVEQAKIGVNYCKNSAPKFNDPQKLFNYYNHRVIYKNDPPNTELIQSAGTLFENNFHGIPGAGDCDCFATLLLSSLWANGMNENYIVLYGRSKRHPSHISIMTVFNGNDFYLDLTEKKFNTERHYPFKQLIPVFE